MASGSFANTSSFSCDIRWPILMASCESNLCPATRHDEHTRPCPSVAYAPEVKSARAPATAIETRQPSAQAHDPKREVGQHQGHPGSRAERPERSAGANENSAPPLPFRPRPLQSLRWPAPGPGCSNSRAARLTNDSISSHLIDAHQVARFSLEEPDAHVRQGFERRGETALWLTRAAGHAAHAPVHAAQKTDEQIPFPEGKGAQDDGLGFADRHRRVGAPTPRKIAPQPRAENNYHSDASRANAIASCAGNIRSWRRRSPHNLSRRKHHDSGARERDGVRASRFIGRLCLQIREVRLQFSSGDSNSCPHGNDEH